MQVARLAGFALSFPPKLNAGEPAFVLELVIGGNHAFPLLHDSIGTELLDEEWLSIKFCAMVIPLPLSSMYA